MISTRKDGDSPFWWYLPEKMEIFHGDLLVYRRVYNQRFQGTNLGFNGRLDFRGTGGSLSLKSSDSSFSCWTSWKISKCVLIFFNATPLLPSVPPPLFFTKKILSKTMIDWSKYTKIHDKRHGKIIVTFKVSWKKQKSTLPEFNLSPWKVTETQ